MPAPVSFIGEMSCPLSGVVMGGDERSYLSTWKPSLSLTCCKSNPSSELELFGDICIVLGG